MCSALKRALSPRFGSEFQQYGYVLLIIRLTDYYMIRFYTLNFIASLKHTKSTVTLRCKLNTSFWDSWPVCVSSVKQVLPRGHRKLGSSGLNNRLHGSTLLRLGTLLVVNNI